LITLVLGGVVGGRRSARRTRWSRAGGLLGATAARTWGLVGCASG